ncbi:hypothetical protein OCU04_009231 [Sclerotinia nivalis]|uniref:Uncharacterized protein n=1 Tax=Sclerotinia nivalis TaxID=352851 RepID=A0A9X0AH59_9HELO|nr:hypothetical protein OCU04_009231 [Sclerotinia nivalis]
MKSIKEDFDPLTLKKIDHFHFPPWKRNTPYKINISKLAKEDIAIVYNLIFKYRYKNTITIYTNTSSTLNGIEIDIRIAIILSNNQISYQKTINIEMNQLIYNNKLLKITRTIEYTNSIAQPNEKFKIYSNNQTGLYQLKIPSDTSNQIYQIRAIKAIETFLRKETEISFNWILKYTFIKENELVDTLTKEATKQKSSSNEINFASLEMDIKRTKSKK